MYEIIKSGGLLMLPIIACSIVALAIIVERLWVLKARKVAPASLIKQIREWYKDNALTEQHIQAVHDSSPLGRILAAGLLNSQHSRDVMKESIEEVGRQVAHELERFLNTLGTVAAISPLLGLLGTVLGMITVFAVITTSGVGSPGELAGGISQALITTAAGLTVAIPSLIFHRYLRRRIDSLVIDMEQQALMLVDVIHGEREAKISKGKS